MEAPSSSETSVLAIATRRNIPENGILYSHRREHLKSYIEDVYGSDYLVRFEVFTAVTMKNAVFWDVTSCGSCKNRRFEGTYRLHYQCEKKQRARNVSNN
jgi:hypothetical protein